MFIAREYFNTVCTVHPDALCGVTACYSKLLLRKAVTTTTLYAVPCTTVCSYGALYSISVYTNLCMRVLYVRSILVLYIPGTVNHTQRLSKAAACGNVDGIHIK